MAERKFAGPKLPATLGNVALKVSEYATKDGVTTVKGNHLQTGEDLSVQLMSPVRAANMMKGRNDVDDRERIRIWEDRFANRRDLTVFADQSNEHSVKPGGVLLLNNTRLDFSDRRYYAQAAYGFVSDPDAQAAISGMISLSKFNDGSIRLQVFQPENASLLSASDKEAAQQSVKAAFEARSPVGPGVMARAVIVTLKEAGGEGQSKAFYMRSASFEADSGNGVQFQLSNGFGDTLKRTNLDSNSGAGAAAIAAATGVSVQMVLDRLGTDATEDDRDSLKKIYDAVASGATSAALTPGYTIPIVLKSVEHLSKRPELFHSGAFSGAVAIAVRGAGGGALERPAAYAVTSYSTLPKSEPENAPTPAKEAIKAHDRLVSSTGGSAEAAPATRPPARFVSPGRDF